MSDPKIPPNIPSTSIAKNLYDRINNIYDRINIIEEFLRVYTDNINIINKTEKYYKNDYKTFIDFKNSINGGTAKKAPVKKVVKKKK
uniref:Uncharacterized protein n=1 Tax=viral metagenome TaxID=1070528 RepID=A0A6C0J025_9ZZZZ